MHHPLDLLAAHYVMLVIAVPMLQLTQLFVLGDLTVHRQQHLASLVLLVVNVQQAVVHR